MIKRPLNPRFSDAVREGRKTTTIRDKAWPVGVPIMLYNWSGEPYRSKQVDVAAVVVRGIGGFDIRHTEDGRMFYIGGFQQGKPIFEMEGFESQAAMDDWFRPLVKPGCVAEKRVMLFRLATEAELKGIAG
jgi:hypothetical protein